MMAAAALRVSCLTTAVVLHRACISASYDFSASSLVSAMYLKFPSHLQPESLHSPTVLDSSLLANSAAVWSERYRNEGKKIQGLGRCVCVLVSHTGFEHSIISILSLPQVGRRSFPWRAGKMWGVHSISKTRLVQNAGDMSSSETPPSFSGEGEAEVALAKKKCTPCSSKELQPMTEESTRSLLEQVPGWDLLEVDGQLQLQKNWKAKNFVKGLEFIKSIAEVAESEGHHPDLHLVNRNDVKVNIWTHSIGGLSENDFILAAKINTLSGEGFLRKSVSKSTPKPPTVAI